MLRHKKKCTVEEEQRRTGDQTWDVFLHELDKLIGLMVARGVIGGQNFTLKSFWDSRGVVKCFRKPCQEIDLLKL